MTLGIVDVGTNSIHLMVGLFGLNGRFHVIVKERDLTRLGEGGLNRGALTRASRTRAMTVLRRYAEIMKRAHVEHVEAVATSAVRGASNGAEFVERVRSATGIPLRIISGREEARLIYLGVFQEHRFNQPATLIAIGGGSAQVVYGQGARQKYAVSVPLGAHRLAQRFIRHDPPLPEEVAAMARHAARAWAPVARALKRRRLGHAVGSSAAIAHLMVAAYLNDHARPPKKKRKLSVSRASLRRLVTRLSASTAADRIEMAEVDPRREDLLLPAAVALLTWMEECGVPVLRYAPGSLREGLVVDYLLDRYEKRSRLSGPLEELFYGNGNGGGNWTDTPRDIVVRWKGRWPA